MAVRYRVIYTGTGEYLEWPSIGTAVTPVSGAFEERFASIAMGYTRVRIFEQMEAGGWKQWLDHERSYRIVDV